MDFLGRCASELYAFPSTPPAAPLGHRLGPPAGSVPASPSLERVPIPAHLPHKCEVISPRQALALSPQMFAQSPAGSRGAVAEVSVGCTGAQSLLCAALPPLPPPAVPPGPGRALCTERSAELVWRNAPSLPFPSSSRAV